MFYDDPKGNRNLLLSLKFANIKSQIWPRALSLLFMLILLVTPNKFEPEKGQIV